MIYYFSATGNSKHAASVIAGKTGDTAVSIADILNGKAEIAQDSERTGLVFPVYFWGLPEIIKRFASLPEFRKSLGKYVYCIITCGATTGTADRMLEKKLGRKLDYSFSLKMPDNYVVLYDPSPKEKAKRFLAHADRELEMICEDINSLAKKHGGSTGDKIKSVFVPPLYDVFRTTKRFYADDKCTSCGMCARNCPDGAIEMKDGKPIWIKSKCQHCTACINCCPTEAIQFGNGTKNRRRYNYDKTIK